MGHMQFVSTLILHTAVVNPGLNWIRQPGRFSRSTAILYSIAFLVAIAAASIGYEIAGAESNFYKMMDVSRDSSLTEIKKAYRVRSVELHPDKNPSATASEDFNRLRLAYDILSDSDKRVIYDLYGEESALEGKDTSEFSSVVSLISFYVVWVIMTYLNTLGSSSEIRSWCYSGCLLLLIFELNVAFGTITLSKNFFPQTTLYEIIQALHLAYPAYMNGCRAMGDYFIHDMTRENYLLSIELLKSNKAILMGMRQIQVEIQGLGRRSRGGAMNSSIEMDAPKRSKMDKSDSSTSNPANANKVQMTEVEKELVQPTPAVQSPPGFYIPGFVYGIAFYFVIYYFIG